jgi:hypothetical protein
LARKNSRYRIEQNDPLAVASRNTDALAEEHGLEKACEILDIDLNALRYMVEQRGMRAFFARRGVSPDYTVLTPIGFTPEEYAEVVILAAAVMDGIAIGWEARRILRGREEAV